MEIICLIHGECLKDTIYFQLQRVERLDDRLQLPSQSYRAGEEDQDIHITVWGRLSPGFGPVQDQPAQAVSIDGLETGLNAC
jgi:hypothetical protein